MITVRLLLSGCLSVFACYDAAICRHNAALRQLYRYWSAAAPVSILVCSAVSALYGFMLFRT